MRAGTMPLPVDVEYLPIYLWEQSRGEPFDFDRDFHTDPALRPGDESRCSGGSCSSTGCSWPARSAGRGRGGSRSCLIATEPSLLGHACLATTDISVTG